MSAFVELEPRVAKLEYKINGNGSKGIEARLQDMEACYDGLDDKVRAIELLEDSRIRRVVTEVITRKDRTAVATIKAVAMLLTPAVALALGILGMVHK